MRKLLGSVLILILGLPVLAQQGVGPQISLDALPSVNISSREAVIVARKIWANEFHPIQNLAGLTDWDPTEAFPSLGIGHFIWYPPGPHGPFTEVFPMYLAFLREKKIAYPAWLDSSPHCPWENRAEFRRDFHSPRMEELRAFLARTTDEQALFMADRLRKALPRMLRSVPPERRAAVLAQFTRVARSPGGWYPLIDYLNFKNEGTLASERYKGQGWGLLQVLEEMKGSGSGPQALKEFSRAAEFVLERRVRNSPHHKHDAQWLPIWKIRAASYAKAH